MALLIFELKVCTSATLQAQPRGKQKGEAAQGHPAEVHCDWSGERRQASSRRALKPQRAIWQPSVGRPRCGNEGVCCGGGGQAVHRMGGSGMGQGPGEGQGSTGIPWIPWDPPHCQGTTTRVWQRNTLDRSQFSFWIVLEFYAERKKAFFHAKKKA